MFFIMDDLIAMSLLHTSQSEQVTTPIQFGQLHLNTLVMTQNLCWLGYTVIKIWECQWDKIVKAKNINIVRPGCSMHCG